MEILRKDFLSLTKNMWTEFERASRIPHYGERGQELEKILIDFLSERLPNLYSVGRGFVVASNNEKSLQQDIVIYDEQNNPMISSFRTQNFYPIESVYAVIQVKSILDKTRLKDAFHNIKAVKTLPTQGGFYMGEHGMIVYPPPPPPLGIVFAFKSKTKLRTLQNNLLEFHSGEDPKHWINMICVLERGICFYGDLREMRLEIGSDNLNIEESRDETLFTFYILLQNYLSFAGKRIVNFRAYTGKPSKTSWIQEALNSLR